MTIEEDGDNVGLFGLVSEEATIENVGVENETVKASGYRVGGLIDWAA